MVFYLVAYLPWLLFYGALATVSVKALKGGSRGMNAFSASIGQTFCVMAIVVVPFLVLILMVLFGLGGSMLVGWAGGVAMLAGWLHDGKKCGYLYLLPAVIAAAMFCCALEWSMPYPDWAPPAWFLTIQHLPVLPFLQN